MKHNFSLLFWAAGFREEHDYLGAHQATRYFLSWRDFIAGDHCVFNINMPAYCYAFKSWFYCGYVGTSTAVYGDIGGVFSAIDHLVATMSNLEGRATGIF